MLNDKFITEVVFCDIETTSQYPNFKSTPEELKAIFKRRYKKKFEEEWAERFFEGSDEYELETEAFYDVIGPLQPEWGKILCISIGTLTKVSEEEYKVKVTRFADVDEKALLTKFMAATASITAGPVWKYHWAAHNGRSFDFPFIAKRIILNRLPLPKLWDFGELKPWEMKHLIDTKEVWRFGVYDNAVSLNHLAYMFDIPTSKDDIEGSQVKEVFWNEGAAGLERIGVYCDKDVVALARIYAAIKGMNIKITN